MKGNVPYRKEGNLYIPYHLPWVGYERGVPIKVTIRRYSRARSIKQNAPLFLARGTVSTSDTDPGSSGTIS